METKEILNLVVAGHVDHGKSTVIGRLFYDTGSLPQGAIDKVRRIAKETGKDFEFAYLLDAFEEEQKQGITIDTTSLQFHTARRDYVIIDAPGHKEFLKNMISGAADAEAAFLVIDAGRGVEEQSKRHAYMLSLLGIRQLCVIVNKLDLVGYDEAVYRRISNDMDEFLKSISLSARAYIPLSALRGENVLKKSAKLPWYQGLSLIEALDDLAKERGLEENTLRFPVQDVYKFDDRRIIAGRLESGRLRVGDEIVIHPGGQKTTVSSLAFWLEKDRQIESVAGQSIGLTVADEFFHRRGEVISHAVSPPLVTRAFKASLFWMGRKSLKEQEKFKLKIATQETEAEISEILRVIDASTLAAQAVSGQVNQNDVAEVIINTRAEVALDLFAVCRATGRFVLVDGFDVAGGGIVTEVLASLSFSGFADGELKAVCALFDEFYYSLEDQAVNKRRRADRVYLVGEAVPLSGKSYSYPEFFDIVIIRDQVAVKIRAGLVSGLVPLEEYCYEGLPMLNERGFAFKVRSRADWLTCLEHYAADKDAAALSARWLDFNAYRNIPFFGNDWVI